MAEAAGRWGRIDEWVRRHPLAPDLALAAVLAVALLPSSLPPILNSSWPANGRAALVLTLLVAHGSVALRRLRPALAFGLASAAMLALLVPRVDGAPAPGAAAFPAILLPSALVFPVLLYAVSAHCRRRLASGALAVGLVGAALTAARLWNLAGLVPSAGAGEAGRTRLYLALTLVASVLAPWALGRFRQVRVDYVDSLRERGAREERTRIAREVHDVVAHSLAVMVSQAEGGRMVSGAGSPEARVFRTIADTGREALTDMRSLVGVLRAGRDSSAAGPAPQPGLADLPALVDRVRVAGTPVTVHESGNTGELSAVGELTAYRVVQEALTNVVKHAAPGAAATLRLQWQPEALVVEVHDEGGVGRSRPADGSGGHGLDGMHERVGLVGGCMDVARTERGWRVAARVPTRRGGSR